MVLEALEVNPDKAEVLHQIREWGREAWLIGVMHYTMYIQKMNTAIFNNSEEAKVLYLYCMAMSARTHYIEYILTVHHWA